MSGRIKKFFRIIFAVELLNIANFFKSLKPLRALRAPSRLKV